MKQYSADILGWLETDMDFEADRVARLNLYRHAARRGMVQVDGRTTEWIDPKLPAPHKVRSIDIFCDPVLG